MGGQQVMGIVTLAFFKYFNPRQIQFLDLGPLLKADLSASISKISAS